MSSDRLKKAVITACVCVCMHEKQNHAKQMEKEKHRTSESEKEVVKSTWVLKKGAPCVIMAFT